MKDIEWLKEAKRDYLREEINSIGSNAVSRINIKINDIIDQLDELEVEENFYTFDNSKKWLEDNGFVVFEKDKLDAEVQRMIDETYKTMNEKPVIPNYVAKWISVHHERFDLYPALKRLENNALSWEGVYDWYRKNTRKFVNAYLTGEYEVEEEKKYEVRCKGELLLTYYTNIEEVVSMNRWDNHLSKKAGRDWKLRHQLTEQEIKDYDPRYMTFAKPVEELEE